MERELSRHVSGRNLSVGHVTNITGEKQEFCGEMHNTGLLLPGTTGKDWREETRQHYPVPTQVTLATAHFTTTYLRLLLPWPLPLSIVHCQPIGIIGQSSNNKTLKIKCSHVTSTNTEAMRLECAREEVSGCGWCVSAHTVEEARLVSSCLSCPSRARPRLSLLSASSGRTENTLLRVNPGATGQPTLQHIHLHTVPCFTIVSLLS